MLTLYIKTIMIKKRSEHSSPQSVDRLIHFRDIPNNNKKENKKTLKIVYFFQ